MVILSVPNRHCGNKDARITLTYNDLRPVGGQAPFGGLTGHLSYRFTGPRCSRQPLGLGVLGLGVEPIGEEAEFRRRCEQRRRAAQEAGRNFGSSFDWVVSPKTEIFRLLRARVRMLSLHELVPG